MKKRHNVVTTSILVLTSCLLVSCTRLWNIQQSAKEVGYDLASEELVVIERTLDRISPEFRYYLHKPSGMTMGHARIGSIWDETDRLETPPGEVLIRAMITYNYRYLSEVEFNAEAGHDYALTLLCIPYPYSAIVDKQTARIVAIDAYCPDCKSLIGTSLTMRSECHHKAWLHPAWIKPDESNWLSWMADRGAQDLRSLCYAADRGLKSARMSLGFIFSIGHRGIPKDLSYSYFWYKMAKDPDDHFRMDDIEKAITTEQRAQALEMMNTWRPGDCEKKLLGSYRQKYELELP